MQKFKSYYEEISRESKYCINKNKIGYEQEEGGKKHYGKCCKNFPSNSRLINTK